MKSLDDEINTAWAEYNAKLDDIIRRYQEAYINPYLEKMGYSLIVGNGTFWMGFDDPNGPPSYPWKAHFRTVDPDKLPCKIREIVQHEIPGWEHGNDFGSLMSDFTPSVERGVLIDQGLARRLPNTY